MRGMWDVVVAADDRTGALEVAGAIAERLGAPVPMLPFASAFVRQPASGGWRVRERGMLATNDPAFVHGATAGGGSVNKRVVVVDLGSRHLSEDEARARAVAVEGVPARRRAHKIDSALRGNWAHEVAARLAVRPGPAVVLAALPDTGRIVRDGVVLQRNAGGDHEPIADAMGDDPRGGPAGSRPDELLRAAGAPATVIVPDVEHAEQLEATATAVASDETVLAVGTAAALAAWAVPDRDEGGAGAALVGTAGDVVVACGSLHDAARRQLARLAEQDDERVTVLATDDDVEQPLPDEVAEAVLTRFAAEVADVVSERSPAIVVVLGGDTAAAVLGDHPMFAFAPVRPGAPVSRRADGTGPSYVTRSGSFGDEGALVDLVAAIGGHAPTRPA